MARAKKSLFERLVPLGIPLAWLQLTGERKRFFVAIAGITFAVAMMLFQMGLQKALFKQVVGPLLLLDGDVVMVGYHYEYFGVGRGFPIVRLHQSKALPEVAGTAPIKLGCASFKNVENGRERDIFLIAFDPTKLTFTDPEINKAAQELKMRGCVAFDRLSRQQYGNVCRAFEKAGNLKTEIAGHSVDIKDLVSIGATFAADGNVLMSIDTLLDIWPNAKDSIIDVGVIRLKKGSDPQKAADALKKMLPDDVNIMTKAQYIENEKQYWAVRTPIGFVIGASMAVAIFVGAVIVYQILYTDVSDHIPEYATLKAIGFGDGFFIWTIVQESIILSVSGFVPGTILAAVLYKLTRDIGNMPTYMSASSLAIVFGLTVGMCVIAGLLATRKLRKANPADIF